MRSLNSTVHPCEESSSLHEPGDLSSRHGSAGPLSLSGQDLGAILALVRPSAHDWVTILDSLLHGTSTDSVCLTPGVDGSPEVCLRKVLHKWLAGPNLLACDLIRALMAWQ